MTIDLVDADGMFAGWGDHAWPRLMARSLHEYTAKLRHGSRSDPPRPIDTGERIHASAIQLGICCRGGGRNGLPGLVSSRPTVFEAKPWRVYYGRRTPYLLAGFQLPAVAETAVFDRHAHPRRHPHRGGGVAVTHAVRC